MRTGLCIIILAALSVSGVEVASAQVGTEQRSTLKATMDQLKAFSQRLPERARQLLSGSARNLINLAERFDQIEPSLSQAPAALGLASDDSKRGESDESARGRRRLEPRQVSDPSTDVTFSSFAGFTQSETSTAWCGNNVVVGFNDSGSFFETTLPPRAPLNGQSFVGFARSTNRGLSFTDMRFLNPGPVENFLGGDPVVRCTDPRTFYFASLLSRPGTTHISVSKSTDGGATFGDPVSAVSKDAFEHLLDKPWMDVDPTQPNRIYVTYTDFDNSGVVCGFDIDGFPVLRTAIELVRSDDGGTTWSAPVAVQEICGGLSFVQGSQVAVGPNGEVYVAWEQIADFLTREIDIRKSTDNGVTFGDIVKVDDVTPVGDGFLLQGAFRSAFDFPSLGVDRSAGGRKHGNVYITWHDARNLLVQDPIAGRYGFADVLFSRSTDGGTTWSSPVRVNDNTEPSRSGLGTDQYQPGIAVDRTGTLGVCFYDRREDANNFLIDRFCAFSTNAGASWTNTRITTKNFAAVPAQDLLINPVYMGDYDSLATDFTQVNSGFIGAWGDNSLGNPDVKANSLTKGRSQSHGPAIAQD